MERLHDSDDLFAEYADHRCRFKASCRSNATRRELRLVILNDNFGDYSDNFNVLFLFENDYGKHLSRWFKRLIIKEIKI